MSDSLKTKTVKGTLWSVCDKFGVMAIQFVVNLILTRQLTPDDFGTIGFLYIFLAIAQTFIDGGFGSALIQKKHPTETDYSTILYWNVFIGTIIYAILFCSAPWVADFYRLPILTDILRIIGISLVLNGIIGLQVSRLQKQLKFNQIATTDISSSIIGAGISIAMVFCGCGVWSLVAMTLSQSLLRIIIIFAITRWLPKGRFSKESFRSLMSFGGFLLVGNLLESVCKNLQGPIIGRKFSTEQMGYYAQADKLGIIVTYSIPQVIAVVMYPVFSQFQDEKERLRELVKANVRVMSFLIYPLLTLLIIVAEPLISLLYKDKWLPSAPYFQILCVGGFFYALNNIAYYAVAACGKSKTLFMLSFYKWILFGLFLLIGMNFGMNGIVWATSVSYLNIFLANYLLAKKYIHLTLTSVFLALLPSLLVAGLVGLAAYALMAYAGFHWIVASIIYVALYAGIAYVLKMQTLDEVKSLLTKLINKHK